MLTQFVERAQVLELIFPRRLWKHATLVHFHLFFSDCIIVTVGSGVPESKFPGIQSRRRYDNPQWFTPPSGLQNWPSAFALASGALESKFHGLHSRRYDNPQWFTPPNGREDWTNAFALASRSPELKFPGIQNRRRYDNSQWYTSFSVLQNWPS